jgi:hypothetical protein
MKKVLLEIVIKIIFRLFSNVRSEPTAEPISLKEVSETKKEDKGLKTLTKLELEALLSTSFPSQPSSITASFFIFIIYFFLSYFY